MKSYGRSTVSEFLGDNIVFRNLIPVDPHLPGLPDIWEAAGLASNRVPRKTTQEYAKVITYLLDHISRIHAPGSPIERVIFLGDTRLNDATAFQNICQAGGWNGLAFIAAENLEPPVVDIVPVPKGTIMYANRWSALEQIEKHCAKQDFQIDHQTVVLLDLDKTTLGARGRNDKVIDQVRVKAANQVVRELLGDDFDQQVFSTAYQSLNYPEFHSFTADNQDYLVYICMIISSGLTSLDSLMADIKNQRITCFDQFLLLNEENKERLPINLRKVHGEVFELVNLGDPTPFKGFRREEYKQTVAHMGQMVDGLPIEQLLQEEVTITQEVRRAALRWRDKGAILFGLSDKPDEASLPNPEMISQGYLPIHQVETCVVGA
jgi:hypothetical protein